MQILPDLQLQSLEVDQIVRNAHLTSLAKGRGPWPRTLQVLKDLDVDNLEPGLAMQNVSWFGEKCLDASGQGGSFARFFC